MRQGVLSRDLDLKSAWYDTTTVERLAAFVQRTLTTDPPGFTPPEDVRTSTRPPLHTVACLPGFSPFYIIALIVCTVNHVFLGSLFFLEFCSVLFSDGLAFFVIVNFWWSGL